MKVDSNSRYERERQHQLMHRSETHQNIMKVKAALKGDSNSNFGDYESRAVPTKNQYPGKKSKLAKMQSKETVLRERSLSSLSGLLGAGEHHSSTSVSMVAGAATINS